MIKLSAEIYVGQNTYEISNNLISVSFSGQDRSDPLLPSWGIKSNSGYLEMFDADGTIEKLSREGSLANSEIKIYLNVGERKEQVGSFYIINAEKDRQTDKTKIDFEDVLMSWNQIQMSGYYYNYYPRNIYLYDILSDVIKNSSTTLKYFNQQTEDRLKNILIPNPTLESGSLWALATKICEVGSCYIFCDNNGIPNIYYDGGA